MYESTYEAPKAVLILHLHLQVRVKESVAPLTCFPHRKMLLKIATSSMMLAMIAICQAVPVHDHVSLKGTAHHQQEKMATSHQSASDSSSIGKQGKRL